jgi:hypothetical protein
MARRQSALSIKDGTSAPNEDDSLLSKDSRHLGSQVGYLLFRLPFELRLDTYELVLGIQKIHIPRRTISCTRTVTQSPASFCPRMTADITSLVHLRKKLNK